VDVTVTNPNGNAMTLAAGFTYYLSVPIIHFLMPNKGSEAGGTVVILHGSDFMLSGVTQVLFGLRPATNVEVYPGPYGSFYNIRCTVPPGALGPIDVTVINPDATVSTKTGGFTYEPAAEGEGEGEGEVCGVDTYHSADQDNSSTLSLSEVLRVIQFYEVGSFGCSPGTEDGYAPGNSAQTNCCPHSSDYRDGASWSIDLNELLRLIQFFNGSGYHACAANGTEDGFCPGLP
jgi:hypothetical protein